MKTFSISVILIMMTLLFLPNPVSAESNTTVEVCLQKQPQKEIPLKNDNDGRRLPCRPIISIISVQEGISIPSVNNDDILLYEVADTEGNTLVEFTDEYEFVTYVLSLNQDCEIIIHLDDYILVGYISI